MTEPSTDPVPAAPDGVQDESGGGAGENAVGPAALRTGRIVVGENRAVEQGLRPVPNTGTHSQGRKGIKESFKEIPYTVLGSRIFYCILGLAVLMAIAITVFAVVTYPSIADVRRFLGPGATGADTLRDWQDARTAWVSQITTIGQLFLFGSILPLLATIVGYLLGERRGSRREQE